MPTHLLRPQGDFPYAGLPRRLAAMAYDTLLSLALLMVVTFAYLMCLKLIYGETQLKAMTDAGALNGDPLLSTLLLFSLFAFFAKFWTHNGQTLGMQVWGVRVQNANGSAIDLWQALLRFLLAIISFLCFGLGFIWMLFDKQKRSWHDIYSGSCMVQLPKKT
ncbi:MAG: RDD family protein [Pseudomonas sp.]|uniref:RDD family protein n=1 Tax=Pseudomonas sp. TaxID=306 RepID=UPI002733939C|nr:RDD family protein [Pseudomonas sp.]MDP3848221.1 RDD family protein [Pseudomonas sp.]